MAEFLSPAWIHLLDAALRTIEPDAAVAAAPFVIEQCVTLPDGSTHRHQVVLGEEGFRAAFGAASPADLVLTTDLETAIAIQRGAVNAQFALAAGHLRLGGDLGRLLAHSDVFTRLDDAFVALRAATTFPTTGASGGHR